MSGTYLRADEAIQTRHCNLCGQEIESGERHAVFCSNSFYSKNACKDCISEINRELNGEGVEEAKEKTRETLDT